MKTATVLLKLALGACERGDPAAAGEALRALLAVEAEARAQSSTPPRAVPPNELARMLSYTPRHIRDLINRGEIPRDAIIGRGKGMRILVDAAIDTLRASRSIDVAPPIDPIELEGAEYARKRSRFRVVERERGGPPGTGGEGS